MCGLAGFWYFKQAVPPDLSHIAAKMGQHLQHRGPDSSGVWCDNELPLAMVHQRLSIRDLSIHGAQPMQSLHGRWIIAYNGEIYNAHELQKNLQQNHIHLRGHSDTEILLESIALEGLDVTLRKMNGMFAFALWDQQEKVLYLVRDRLGIKPLYWGFKNNILFFASQLSALTAHPAWQGEIDRDALISYFRFNYIPAPYSIYRDINKLTPGQYVVINARGDYHERTYWSLQDSVCATSKVISEKGAIEELHRLLLDAVKSQMVADVPLGAFLSGGIDSSTVVALMQAQSTQKIKTFSIGFFASEYNEAPYAKQVAEYLGTEHHELYFSPQDAMNLIPELPCWYDEPFADASQLPTLLVSKLARQYVTVSLSGDGGDELFAGYTRYFLAYKMHQRFALLPFFLRYLLAQGVLWVKPQHWESLVKVIPARRRPQQMGDKAHKFAVLLKARSEEFYRSLVSMWSSPSLLVREAREKYVWPELKTNNFITKMQLLDSLTYLPDDILTKVDRASMAVSLEARVPLLDHRVVEFAFQLSQDLKIRGNQGKWILRQILKKYVPQILIDRPKMGFGVPIGDWLRGPLQAWADDLLAFKKLDEVGLNAKLIQQKWQEHKSGQRQWQYSLWGVLMFQAWREKNGC